MLLAVVNGSKGATSNDFNRYEQAVERIAARNEYPRRAANLAMTLLKEGKLPAWAVAQLDMKKISLAADEPKSKTRRS